MDPLVHGDWTGPDYPNLHEIQTGGVGSVTKSAVMHAEITARAAGV
jgi:hypothetical protein